MVSDPLSEPVLRRFEELGLPASLLEIEEFRTNFFRGWLMLVRDRDKIADVHLIQPKHLKHSVRKEIRNRRLR